MGLNIDRLLFLIACVLEALFVRSADILAGCREVLL
jgi:hypothetical protein